MKMEKSVDDNKYYLTVQRNEERYGRRTSPDGRALYAIAFPEELAKKRLQRWVEGQLRKGAQKVEVVDGPVLTAVRCESGVWVGGWWRAAVRVVGYLDYCRGCHNGGPTVRVKTDGIKVMRMGLRSDGYWKEGSPYDTKYERRATRHIGPRGEHQIS